MQRAGTRWLAALLALTAATAAGRDARAHGDVDIDRPEPPSAPSPATASATPRPEDAQATRTERSTLTLDMVLGWGTVPFAVQSLPGTGDPSLTYSRSDRTQADVQSFVLAGSTEWSEHWGAGVRLPFTFASFSPAGSPSRSTSSFGNIELYADTAAPLAQGLRLVGSIGLALPTAPGQEVPPGLTGQSAAATPESAYDRWSLSRAAVFARGEEEDALFEPQRLGLIPKIGLLYRRGSLRLEPTVKVESLFATSSSLQAAYVGEVVAALRVGYAVHEHLEIAARGWVTVGYAGTSDDRTTVVAVEPGLVLRFGSVRPYAGVILPLAGPPSDNGFFGVRAGVTVSF
jgi:hypothetical protein